MARLYDKIGEQYDRYRRTDPRIERLIIESLSGASSVVNVGAGTGSYEPVDRNLTAVESSTTMILQRKSKKVPIVQASANNLPFRDKTFDASLAILTVHHWPNPKKGLREMIRVAMDRVVILTWDPASSGFWLVNDYFPEILQIDQKIFPSIEDFQHELGRVSIMEVPIPHDCTDGFLGAYWRRPHAYLDANIRRSISSFSKIKDISPSLEKLRRDLETGEWHHCNSELISKSDLDLGYRLIIATLK
jgi:SAM-dependent methyltransferase